MRIRNLITAGLLFIFTTLHSVYAGSRLEYDVSQSSGKERITIYIDGDQARIISSANGSSAVIYNSGSRQINILDHANKVVTTLDQASLEQLASVARGMGEVAKSQGGVLGDIFKTFGLDNTLGERAVIEVKALDGAHTYSGQSCQMYQVVSGGMPATDFCLSPKLKLARPEQNTLDSLIAFAQLLLREGQMVLEQFSLPIPLMPEKPLQGMPVYLNDRQSKTSAVLIGLKQLEIASQQFQLPAGYEQRTLSL